LRRGAPFEVRIGDSRRIRVARRLGIVIQWVEEMAWLQLWTA
jgi:hypothetical protein